MKNILPLLIYLSPLFSSAQIITTIAGNGPTSGIGSFSGDGGLAVTAGLYSPNGVAADCSGNLYIADAQNRRVRRVNSAGIILTFAGGGTSGIGDSGPATNAILNGPLDVAVDNFGNVFIADGTRIRKVSSTGTITTIAGPGPGGSGVGGDGGPATAAQVDFAWGIAVDNAGNTYYSENHYSVIRKINAAGIISTIAGVPYVAGTCLFGGDGGPATSAHLCSPLGIAVDDNGNVYFSDAANGRIRKIGLSGIITTVAGNGSMLHSGDGSSATTAGVPGPVGLALDSRGSLYFCEGQAEYVRNISLTGIISTVAGIGTYGYSGDGGPPLSAQLNSPMGIAIDCFGSVYIADQRNNRVRYIRNKVSVNQIESKQNVSVTIFPNPSNGAFTIVYNAPNNEVVKLLITDLLGRKIREISACTNTRCEIILNSAAGIYLLTSSSSAGIIVKTILVN